MRPPVRRICRIWRPVPSVLVCAVRLAVAPCRHRLLRGGPDARDCRSRGVTIGHKTMPPAAALQRDGTSRARRIRLQGQIIDTGSDHFPSSRPWCHIGRRSGRFRPTDYSMGADRPIIRCEAFRAEKAHAMRFGDRGHPTERADVVHPQERRFKLPQVHRPIPASVARPRRSSSVARWRNG